MRRSLLRLAALISLIFSTLAAFTQTITITGNVRNSLSKDAVPAVSVTIKGTGIGTFTDEKGNFKLVTAQKPPFTLVFTSIGYDAYEMSISNASQFVQVDFVPGTSLGEEVVVSASRLPERILESPVSIERMSGPAIRAAAAPNFYDQIANLKGVDLTTSSLTFKTLSTRGFNGSGNLRFNQLVDGMDNQAPGLNFAVGNITGMTELDVDNVELLQGASSALYGSGGMNGTLLMTSKSPFRYQGLSVQIKQGIMHIADQDANKGATPYYDWAFRWGHKVSERFAFKMSGQFVQAQDWQATDYRNLERNNVYSTPKAGDRISDPNYDGVNVFGDEASASMGAFNQAVLYQVNQADPSIIPSITGLAGMGLTPSQIVQQLLSSPTTAPLATYVPFILGGNVIGNQLVSRTGYNENTLVDYNAYNLKLSGGLYYKLSENVEASLLGYWGTGTTVYTGADRYAIKNLKMGQYKAELKGKNWFLRAYTTQENSGDAYTATTAAVAVNRAWKSDQDWFQTYTGVYAAARLGLIPNPASPGSFLPAFDNASAHSLARSQADAGRYLPGTPQFDAAFKNAINKPISKGGAKFDDKTDMYHYEGQLNLSDYVKFAEVLVGGNIRQFNLNSHGTIFADTAGVIKIKEYGGYVQLQRWIVDDLLKLTVSGRYDKNENFKGRFTPRATALIKVAKDNNIRLSYQQAYRFPSTQDQWINLRTPASILIGGLPDFYEYYKFGNSPAYTAESIAAYRQTVNAGTPNPTVLQVASFPTVKPEISNSYEVGFRGLLTHKLLLDAYVYYSQYKDFIARVAVGRGQSASANPAVSYMELASPFTTTNYSFVTNSTNTVNAIGWGLSANYRMGRGYELNVNLSGDNLKDVPAGLITFFNTPKWRYNIALSNSKINGSNWGFNVLYRWQDKVYWEGTFGTGDVPAFGTLDGQVNYTFSKAKTIVKLGATNLLNKYYTSAFGNPYVGGLYYVSVGYNIY